VLLAASMARRRTAVHLAVRADDRAMVGFLLAAAAEAGAAEAARRAAEAAAARARQARRASRAAVSAASPGASLGGTLESAGRNRGGGGGGGGDDEGPAESAAAAAASEDPEAAAEAGRAAALEAFANTADDQGLSVLHEACQRGVVGVVRALLEAGASTTARNPGSRRTPAEAALEAGHAPVSRLVGEFAAAAGAPDWSSGYLRGLYDNDPPKLSKKWAFLD